MIVITGATGQLGRQIVEGLLTDLPGTQVGVSVRDPEKARDFEQRGVRVHKADFTEPYSLAAAFEGAEQVLIISGNTLGAEGFSSMARRFKLPKKLAPNESCTQVTRQPAHRLPWHLREIMPGPKLLQTSGVPFVSLRNGFYAESALYQLGSMRETGLLALPEDGPVSWTARADLAVAAVAALRDFSLFDGITPPLTASEVVTFSDIASLASEILHRKSAGWSPARRTIEGPSWRKGPPSGWSNCFGPCSAPREHWDSKWLTQP